MNVLWRVVGPVVELWRRVLSISVFFKILGIGALVALLFGSVTLFEARRSLSRVLLALVEERSLSLARIVAGGIERSVLTGDLYSVNETLRRTKVLQNDVRYIVALDSEGTVVGHTFSGRPPRSLLAALPRSLPAEGRIVHFSTPEGLIIAAAFPTLGGSAGSLHVGVTDETIAGEVSRATRTLLLGLGLCIALGAVLALLLTHVLTRPVQELVRTADRIREEDFDTEARVFYADEIGRLAVAFNRMTESLREYRKQVEEKERARVQLLDRVVETQEEERKLLSRELHDQVGQSLLALLLRVQSHCQSRQAPGEQSAEDLCHDLEGRVSVIIEEVRRMAWDMRPSLLDDYGLDSALQRFVERVREFSGLRVDYHFGCVEGKERFASRIETSLYRIAQEAISNVVRHAKTDRASLVLLRKDDEVVLVVEDNGQGFDMEKEKEESQRLGLTSMAERASLLGGTLVVDSAPGAGTTVRAQIPVREEEPCRSGS